MGLSYNSTQLLIHARTVGTDCFVLLCVESICVLKFYCSFLLKGSHPFWSHNFNMKIMWFFVGNHQARQRRYILHIYTILSPTRLASFTQMYISQFLNTRKCRFPDKQIFVYKFKNPSIPLAFIKKNLSTRQQAEKRGRLASRQKKSGRFLTNVSADAVGPRNSC